MLGNIDPKFRSRVETIQLVTVVKSMVVAKYGINEILKPFIAAINQLEEVSIIAGLYMPSSIPIHRILEYHSRSLIKSCTFVFCVQLTTQLLAPWVVISNSILHSGNAASAWL
jgi:hypothetical protein